MRRFLFLFLLSISGIPKFVNIKKWPMSTQNMAKNNKIKNTKIKIKCVGGGGLLYLLCLISNTLPQLEQSSLQLSTVLHHRHLQTTSYNHLLLLHHLRISRKEKTKQQQARNPLKGVFGPSTHRKSQLANKSSEDTSEHRIIIYNFINPTDGTEIVSIRF